MKDMIVELLDELDSRELGLLYHFLLGLLR